MKLNNMAAKDYQLCLGMANAYISKVSKKDPNLMLSDRRVLSDEEILSLIHWWAQVRKIKTGNNVQTIMANGDKVVEVVLLKEDE